MKKFLAILLFPLTAFSEECLEKRVVFDIGSGSTKSISFEYNKCEKKIVNKLAEINKHIMIQESIDESSDKKTISKELIEDAKEEVKQLKKGHDTDCIKDKCYGIATSWARTASNSKAFLNVFKENNIYIKVIFRNKEGELGFYTAANDPEVSNIESKNLVVFDIGGGSYQLATKSAKDKVIIKGSENGIFSFGEKLRRLNPSKDHNHNTIRYFNKNEIEKILVDANRIIKKVAAKDSALKKKIKNKNTKIIAIGRAMYLGMKRQLGLGSTFTKDDIKKKIYEFCDIKDQQMAIQKYPKLPQHFASVVQQSLILIYTIMDVYSMESAFVVDSTFGNELARDDSFAAEAEAALSAK